MFYNFMSNRERANKRGNKPFNSEGLICKLTTDACVALIVMFGIHGVPVIQNVNAQVAAEKIEIFKFEEVKKPNPNNITPRKWNWEIELTPIQSKSRFRIVQQTNGKKGLEPEFTRILFSESELQKSSGDVIHFKLYSGDENPTLNMNKKGNVGLGVSFSRVGGGFGTSSWIVLPGRIVKSEVPQQGYLTNAALLLLSIDTRDSMGNDYKTDLRLEQSK